MGVRSGVRSGSEEWGVRSEEWRPEWEAGGEVGSGGGECERGGWKEEGERTRGTVIEGSRGE